MVKNFDDFLKSELDEAGFYGVSRENSIILEDYLDEMIDRDHIFHKIAKNEIESAKRKCNWIENIHYDKGINMHGELTFIYFDTKDGRQICAFKTKEENKFTLHALNSQNYTKHSKYFNEDTNRSKELLNIQNELLEIMNIGEKVYGIDIIKRYSISENFDGKYSPEIGLLIHSGDDLITSYVTNRLWKTDPKRECYYGGQPIIKDSENERLRRKILLKK